ncbi:Methyltransferase-like protein 13 [Phytophthora citrophthora]|uniref:Methyltransferase-like protein 13 n=1 Tax=Phytophthora citrophthora TaxID=4793 RepID=A0AAD9GWL1_9STRA|nr:Methyltransferase-like protein 13 [Phytophthora citrophthora]
MRSPRGCRSSEEARSPRRLHRTLELSIINKQLLIKPALMGRLPLRNWSAARDEVRLRFRCTACGKCCTGSGGRVRVNEREVEELAAATDSSVVEFKRRFTHAVEEIVDGQKMKQFVLRQTPDDKQCVFLKGSKCSVYQARPTQCRTFPWWPQNLISDYDWQLAAKDCEGIHLEDEKEDTPAFSFDDVMPETILHDIHRSGENYTYDELHQMLQDLREVEPDFEAQYKAELFAKFSRRIVFNDEEVTVLDTYLDRATRSFVFNDRLHLTQSEVALSEMPDASSEFDRSTLALDVHRALCMPLAWLSKTKLPLNVCVLGAGACTLPLFLLEHYSPQELGRLDAVEPSSQVNSIARRFFGVASALQRDPRLVIREKMGEEFLQQEREAFDVLVVDVEAGESCDGVRAPPIGMLDRQFLQTAKCRLAPNGILAVNVITESQEALNKVESKIGIVFSRELRLSLPSNSVFFLFNEEKDSDIAEYVRMVQNSVFQTQYAQTPALLETCQLTAWHSSN